MFSSHRCRYLKSGSQIDLTQTAFSNRGGCKKWQELASMLLLFFLTTLQQFLAFTVYTCKHTAPVPLQFLESQHADFVELCYFQAVKTSQFAACAINTNETNTKHKNWFSRGSNKKIRYFVANLKLNHLSIICANFQVQLVLIYLFLQYHWYSILAGIFRPFLYNL